MNHIVSFAVRILPCLALLVALAGCGKTQPPEYRLNMVEIARAQLAEPQQQEIANVLVAMFGTPDEPFVLAESGLDLEKIRVAAGPVRSDEFGKEFGLYRRHCAHCHGTTGDGRGPTAMILDPYPRDYRQGKFKFKATERAAKPTAIDLERVVRHGVPGTAMPAFDLLPDAQIMALIEYVKYLSLRGQTEISLVNAMADLSEGDKLDTSRGVLVDEILAPLAESWTAAHDAIINPPEKPQMALAESIAKGQELFYGTTANCVKCHGPSSLGDGQASDYDDWSKPVHEMLDAVHKELGSLANDENMTSEERSERLAQLGFERRVLETDALPPRTATPRNLRQNVYRGGRAPVDLYRRFYAGINGAPMPGVGPATPGATGTLKPEEIWHLVDYVLSLPYQEASAPPPEQHPLVGQARY